MDSFGCVLQDLQQQNRLMSEDQYFCFITINTEPSMIVEWVTIVLSVVLIGDAFRKFWNMRGSHNSHVTKMYLLILLWWVTFVASSVFCIINYFLAENHDEEYSDKEMSDISEYSFVVNWANAYVIQSILLLVPYHWSKQITGLFSDIQRNSQVAVEDPQDFKGIEKYTFWILKCFMISRIVFLGLPVAFIIFNDFSITIVIFKIMISTLLLDCAFITLSLVFGMISLKTNQQLKQQIDEDQAKRMFNQYIMIIVANTIRFAFDLYYVISNVIGSETFVAKHCPDKSQPIDMALQLGVNICTCFLSHFLPIFIILRIYNLQEKPEEMCKSLLITTSQT